MPDIAYLSIYSEYSITHSILRIDEIIAYAKKYNIKALALTDTHNMFAYVKFYKACVSNGIKPILGATLNIINDELLQYKIIILAKNNHGLEELNELITRSYLENKLIDIPHIKESWLFNRSWQDLIVLSGTVNSDIALQIIQNKQHNAEHKILKWQQHFPNYYLLVQRFNYSNIDHISNSIVTLANKTKTPIAASHPINFATAEDYEAHEVRVCIANGTILDDNKRIKLFSQDQYFLSTEELIIKFKDLPIAITNTNKIAQKCNITLTFGNYFLPKFIPINNLTIAEHLVHEANNGLSIRFTEIINSNNSTEHKYSLDKDIYQKRLNFELDMINQMGFAGYFLIVADFMHWARNNGIPIGPGRGSGAGSLVAFALGITNIEPLRYGLLFERFLNPDRVSMPDFDIDFCPDKRELVINYVKDKYGANAVAQIVTFGTMSSKAAIKDVGRALALPYGLCDSISKLILNTPAKSYHLQDAYLHFGDLKNRIDDGDEDIQRLWSLSLRLEDLTRNVGKHAAGILIAPQQLTHFCPLYLADGMQTSQLDKDDIEQIGLLKFDFLGLRNLTVIADTIINVKKLYNKDIVLSNYDFNDKKVYKLLQSGNAGNIFQLESSGMRRVLTKLKPDCFEDIIALLALYRPGPLGSGMVDDFIKRKNGIEKPNYFHNDLRACLEPTYGVIVYQEQVMQISQIIGGYSLGAADLLRRAMGKKKPEEMALHRNTFIKGALSKGYNEQLAADLFDLMAKFAEYGFNKSHSAAYAVISYHTAFLKTHHLSSFMAATLSSDLDKTDKLFEVYQDALFNKLIILPPDINTSNYHFSPLNDNTISYALGAIKGIGQLVVDLIINERQTHGIFVSFIDFCNRMDKKVLNKKTLESLIKSGSFDSLNNNRASLYASVTNVISHYEKQQINNKQLSLFDDIMCDDDSDLNLHDKLQLTEAAVWNNKELLLMEKQAFGFYFSASLFDDYKHIVKQLNIKQLAYYSTNNEHIMHVINNHKNKLVLVCGVINKIGAKILKNNNKIYFINLEDDISNLEFVIFTKEYDKYRNLLKLDEFIFVEGELIFDNFRQQSKITARHIYTLNEVLAKKVQTVKINLSDSITNEIINDIHTQLSTSGNTELLINYQNEIANYQLISKDKITITYEIINYLLNSLQIPITIFP